MKRLFYASIIAFSTLLIGINAQAQFRQQEPNDYQYTGNILKPNSTTNTSALFKVFNSSNFKMHESYEMTFSSFGGHYYNQNILTSSMLFRLTPRLTGQLDLSMAHSPFGQGFITNNKDQVRFFVRNADLNYRIGKNSAISLHFSQIPYSSYFSPYGYSPLGYGYNPFGYNGYNGFGY